MIIPDREHGYSIEPNTAIVHERYQDHAPLAMRTSARGVSNILDGRHAVPCQACFPVRPKRTVTPHPSLRDTFIVEGSDEPTRLVAREDIEDGA